MLNDKFKKAFMEVMKKNSVLQRMKEKKEAEDKEEFLRRLKYGQPKPVRRTRPPVRLRGNGPPR